MTAPDDLGPAIDLAGKYRLGALLGVGGMAEVFRGHLAGTHGFKREVAIKRVLATYSADERFAQMFISEARLASLLSHPCVVSVIDFDRDIEGRLFQVIEFVHGVDLEKFAPPGEYANLPPEIITYIIGEVLEGLKHAHGAINPQTGKPLGIVHRDCTPSNVLITWDGVVKLSDFGIAKAMQATNATASGTAKGKPMYMAPEQLTAKPTMDGRVDLFATGVMLYELLTGQRPFAGDSVMSIMFLVSQYGDGHMPVETPHAVTQGHASVALSNLAMRLMAPRPEHRPASAQDALLELRACGRAANRDELAHALAERFPDRAPRPASSIVTQPPAYAMPTNVALARAAGASGTVQTIGQTPPPVGDLSGGIAAPRSRRTLAIALGAGVVVLGGIIAVAISGGGGSQSPAPAVAPIEADAPPPPIDAALPDAPPIDAGPAPIDATVDAAPAPIDAARTRRSPGSGRGSDHGFVEKTLGGG